MERSCDGGIRSFGRLIKKENLAHLKVRADYTGWLYRLWLLFPVPIGGATQYGIIMVESFPSSIASPLSYHSCLTLTLSCLDSMPGLRFIGLRFLCLVSNLLVSDFSVS